MYTHNESSFEMQEHNINFFSSSKSKFYECACIKSKSKQKQIKIGGIDFLISIYILKVFLLLSTTFSNKILLGPKSCLINPSVKKFNIHLMFNFVCLRLICVDIFSQNFQLILDGNFNDLKKKFNDQ